jgi:stearoyl-CoA desaturase (delta-9 desaturase)
MFRNKPLNPPFVLLLVGLHVAALAALLFFPMRRIDLVILGVNFLWFGFASSVFYHRGLTHRGYQMVFPLKLFFLLGGLAGFGGAPLQWAAIHRYHHQHSDLPDDVHSPKDGVFYAYMGWCARRDSAMVAELVTRHARDLSREGYLRFFSHPVIGLVPHALYACILFAWLGLGGLLWGLYVPILLSFNFAWMLIASLCHLPGLGSRAMETPDQSRDIGWLGFLTFGESFHNTHHAYPPRVRFGTRWYDVDASQGLIWLLERLGLVWDVVWECPAERGAQPAQSKKQVVG